MIKISKITLEQYEVLKDEAPKDGHYLLNPTHIIFNNEKPAGVLTVGSIPMVLAWIDTRVNKAIHTKKIIDTVEAALRFDGKSFVAFPVSRQSPLHKFCEPNGYLNAYPNNDLFIKAL